MTQPYPSAGRFRAILADDDPRIAGDLCDFLLSEGIACEIVDDWAGLAKRMRRSTPDLVLLPQRLGSREMLSGLADFRAAAPGALMIVKDADSRLDRRRAFDLGADDVLPRFIERRELAARLRAHLRRRQPA